MLRLSSVKGSNTVTRTLTISQLFSSPHWLTSCDSLPPYVAQQLKPLLKKKSSSPNPQQNRFSLVALTRSRVLRLACYWTRDESPALPAWATDTFGDRQSTPFGSPEWRGGAVVPTKETQGAVMVSQRSKGQQYLSELNANVKLIWANTVTTNKTLNPQTMEIITPWPQSWNPA